MPKEEVDIEKGLEDQITKLEAEETTPQAEGTSKDATIPEDPEIDLGEGEKVKLSQIKEWKKGNMLQADYSQKTQELNQQRKEIEELVKFADYLKANPKKLEKVLAVLEEKVEDVKEKVEDELEGLDPTDPYAKLLKKTFDTVKKLENKVASFEQKELETSEEQLVSQAQQVLTKTLEENAKELKFDDNEEKATWRMLVLSYLKDHPQDYKDENDFTSTIKDIGKKYFDALNKIGEARVKKYLDSKKITPSVPSKAAGGVLKATPTGENIEELIQAEIDALESKPKE